MMEFLYKCEWNDRTYYTFRDKHGEKVTMREEDTEMFLRDKLMEVMNLSLDSTGNLIDHREKADEKKMKSLKVKLKALGANFESENIFLYRGGIYEISGKEIVLKQCIIERGTFEIPGFVTEIALLLDNDGISGSPFRYCKNLKVINRGKLDDMSSFFSGCIDLRTLDLSEFNTTGVYNMQKMFEWCMGLRELDLGNFDTSRVLSMKAMFERCSNLKKINVSSFNTSNVKNYHDMFTNCVSLNELDISHFNITDDETLDTLVSNDKSIYYKLWKLPKGVGGKYSTST